MTRRKRVASQAAGGAARADSLNLPIQGNMSQQQTDSEDAGFAKIAKTESGQTLDTSSEAWRLYCEACFVLTLPDKSDRRKQGWKATSKREYLAGVRDKRGQAGHDVLRAEMVRIWKLRFPRESPK